MSSTPSRPSERHVLVVNQHGDNTGDEAALRAMLDGLEQRLAPVRFTVVHQFREKSSEVDVPQDVRWITLVLPGTESLRLVLHALGRLLGRDWQRVLGPVGSATAQAYRTADLVVSAPGGPYFGDVYWSHEPVHWFYVWMARWNSVPAALYAPSAGPFAKRWMNPFRRRTYRCFDVIALREERSARHVRELLGPDVSLEVTADSALQQRVAPVDRHDWLVDGADLVDRFVLCVAAIDSPHGGERHDDAVVAAVHRVADRLGDPSRLHVVLMPQLHSRRHTDAPYLRRLGARLTDGVSWEVADNRSSDVQRARFAASDLVIAGRYHPAVFAISARVPLVCIPYEHKATGLMEAAGLEDLMVPIEQVDAGRLTALVDRALDDEETLRPRLADAEPILRARAARTSELVASVLTGASDDRSPVQ